MSDTGSLLCSFFSVLRHLSLPHLDLSEQVLGIGVVLEVISHWLQKIVQSGSHRGLQVTWVQLLVFVVSHQLLVCLVILGSTKFGLSLHGQVAKRWEDDRIAVVEHGVSLLDAWRAVSILDLSCDVLSRVFHEDG